MPRPSEPRWNKRRQVWYANIGPRDASGRATEVYAPPELGRADKAEAWAWFELAKLARTDQKVDRWTVELVCQYYAANLKEKRDADQLAEVHFANRLIHLRHLADAFGRREASTLSGEEVSAWLAGLSYSANYRANIAAGVSAAFRWATRKGYLERNPIEGFAAPVVPRADSRYAGRSEVAAVLGWAWRDAGRDRRHRSTVLLLRCLAATGARPGELCDLRWSDLSWEAGRTPQGHVFARATIPAERWKAGRKTGRARVLYLTPLLTRALRRLKEAPGAHPTHVFVHGPGRGGRGADQPWESGSRLSKRILAIRRGAIAAQAQARAAERPTGLQALLARVDLAEDGADRWTAYRLRHTAASALLMHGHDLYTVAELLGTSAEVIQSTYGHLLDGHLANAALSLSAAMRSRRPSRPGPPQRRDGPGRPASGPGDVSGS
jgi:integrase